MANIINFHSEEIVAVNYDAAKAAVKFGIQGNATQSYKNWLSKLETTPTQAMIKEFMINYLESKTKCVPGSGFIIVLDPAVTDKRERPYKKSNIKSSGKRVWMTVLNVIGESGKLYKTITPDDIATKKSKDSDKEIRVKKSDADKIVKKMYSNGEIRENVNIYYSKVPRDKSQTIAASYEYTPSKGTKNGRYLCFGIEA